MPLCDMIGSFILAYRPILFELERLASETNCDDLEFVTVVNHLHTVRVISSSFASNLTAVHLFFQDLLVDRPGIQEDLVDMTELAKILNENLMDIIIPARTETKSVPSQLILHVYPFRVIARNSNLLHRGDNESANLRLATTAKRRKIGT